MSDISQQQQQHLWDLVKKGEYEIVCSIIKGAPHVVKWTDSRGQSPLILSCVYGHVAIAKLFLDHGGDFYKKAHSGASAWSSCIYPADREVLERHAYDVSPDGAAAIAREKAAQDRRNEKNERDCMQGEEDYMFDFLEMERILYEQFMYDQMCSRYHFVNGCVVKATERIFFAQYCNAEMAIQDEESQQREDYDKYYDYKMQRFSDLKQLRVEAERERIRQENIRRAEAERLRLLREAEAEAERLRLEEEARLAEVSTVPLCCTNADNFIFYFLYI